MKTITIMVFSANIFYGLVKENWCAVTGWLSALIIAIGNMG